MQYGCIFCKTYGLDFLEHILEKNDEEFNQVYVENHHNSSVDITQWKLVQIELSKKHKNSDYTYTNTFSSKIICCKFGSFYGQKVWNSTRKYRQ